MSMEHTDIQPDTAVRYLLGEFSPADAEAFEAHYFDCSVCASDIRNGMRLLETGLDLPADQERHLAPVVPIDRHRWRWMQSAAAAALVVLLGAAVFNDKLPWRRPAPTLEPIQTFEMSSVVRGGEAPAPIVLAGGRSTLVYPNISLEPAFPHYELSIRNASKKTVLAYRLTEEMAKLNEPLLLSALPAGSYEVVIEGVRENGNRAPIVTPQRFEVRR
jgi:hypothetical protein